MQRPTDLKSISIKKIIIMGFIVLLLATVGTIGTIVFSNWVLSAERLTNRMLEEMSQEIFNDVDTFLDHSLHTNAVNYELLKNYTVNLANEEERERYFVGVLKNLGDDVYSFSYGTEKGEYYGARRNLNGSIEIMRNNADTEGHSWYYSVTGAMTAGERTLDAGKFDPRTRDWYLRAKELGQPVFSAVYRHFVVNDLAISAAYPLYKDGELQGVLGTHIVLSNMNNLLEKIVQNNRGFAVIIEKGSGELIANSFDRPNFTIQEDGTFKRLPYGELRNLAVAKAYDHYQSTQENQFKINNGWENLYINCREYTKDGLDWIAISAIPDRLLLADIYRNIQLTVMLVLLSLVLSSYIYYYLTNRFFRPIDGLIKVTERFTDGDMSSRAMIVRNDELGGISKSFNKMADRLYELVNNLEETVKERTAELKEINDTLKEKEEKLQLILDTAAEAIYGIDITGHCTFCNASCLRLLGYSSPEELIGKNMHTLIHHTNKDGTPLDQKDCRIYHSFLQGEGTHVDDEIFWRADGSSFNTEYFSYPQYKDEKIIGAVVTFLDITERKKAEEDIRYLSYHDSLTGLYNRMFFEEELKRLDTERNLPIALIIGDVNGLKLTNDVFGHTAGDKLLQKVGEILKNVCRADDIIARTGGDEFVVLLPRTTEAETEMIMARIKSKIAGEHIVAIKGSISMGSAVKEDSGQSILKTMEDAEDQMYREKTLNRRNINSEFLGAILENLYQKNPAEKQHSQIVSELCQNIGRAMNLSDVEIRRLKEAGFLHDIGKIVLEDHLLKKNQEFTNKEIKLIREHPVVGYRILNNFEDTLVLAESVLAHHEKWDGSGYPKGLKGAEIPEFARIIAVAESYDKIMGRLGQNPENKEIALREIRQEAGSKYDPEIVNILAKIIISIYE